jgi:hypothetical protein
MYDKRFPKAAKALAEPRRFEIFQKIGTTPAEEMCCTKLKGIEYGRITRQ